MDLHILKSVAGWARVWPVVCLLAWSLPCAGADDPGEQALATPPAVKVDSLLNQLYPNQSGLFGSLSATTTALETPLKPLATPSQANPNGKSAGSLIVYGRKDEPTPASARMAAAAKETSATLRRLKRDFLSTDILRQLKQIGMGTPYVPLSLPSGLDLATLLLPIIPAGGHEKSHPPEPGAAATPRVPLPKMPVPALSPQAPSTAGGETIEINQADAKEIMRKLKLDARRARLIIQFRTLYGPFKTPEDLAQVNGINDEFVRKWENADLLRF